MAKKDKHITYIESLLKDGEEIIRVHQCFIYNGLGAVAITNLRVMCGRKGFFTGENIEEVDIKSIGSVELQNHFTEAVLTIYVNDSHQKVIIRDGWKERLSETRQILVQTLDELKESPVKDTGSKPYSVGDEIQKIVELKQQGHISEKEFEILKSNIINR
ncbi:PH domain-containing protein [Cytobacillus purgationiresistens]|uniref:YokE-like PH domain-containing protein n=1 Tax=Cytobacillus purgationiresistens TaxID=863449 RepID=A0ABU0ARS7_9BACI|nr:PH domain-containing protein [Cytobacillus purgationiresistens]MDQ0273969.1 hypothetical protein [Cytobacillus purgationiresistens]